MIIKVLCLNDKDYELYRLLFLVDAVMLLQLDGDVSWPQDHETVLDLSRNLFMG